MTDYSELKRLAERIREGSILQGMNAEEAMFNFECAATPDAVLALIAENERLSGECEGCPMSIAEELRIELDQFRHEVERYRQYGCGTCDGSGHLHRLDGEYFGVCTSCGAYELEQAKRERDQLKAENEALRSVANELRRFATCETVHHDRPEQHEYDDPCKVLARIDAVLGHGEQSGG